MSFLKESPKTFIKTLNMTNLKKNYLNFLKKSKSSADSRLTSLFEFLIHFYQVFLSGFFGGTCKFHPHCSEYAKQAFAIHTPTKAFILTLKRLSKCHPLSFKFGFDPVPKCKESHHE